MIYHLTHLCQQLENVGVVVQDSALLHISGEFSLSVTEERLVQVLFLLVEQVSADRHGSGWQAEVVRSFNFGSPQHDTVQQQSQLAERFLANSLCAIVLNGLQDLVVPPTDMANNVDR